MKTTTKIIILTAIYLLIFFGTFSWFIIAITTLGFMTPKPTYIGSLISLFIMVLYGNTYLLWLNHFLSWNKKFHLKIQGAVFFILWVLHLFIWTQG